MPLKQSPAVNAAEFDRCLEVLEDLASSEIPLSEFCERFGRELMSALRGPAAAVWLVDRNQGMGLASDIGLRECGFFDDVHAVRLNQRFLAEVVVSRQMETRSFGASEQGQTGGVLLLPIVHQSRPLGVVEVFTRQETLDAAWESHRHALNVASTLVSRYLERLEDTAAIGDPSHVFESYRLLTRRLHETLDRDHVAATAVNELRTMFRVDRVSLFERRGARFRLLEISGQRRISHRSNQVRMLNELVNRTMRSDERFVFEGQAENLPSPIRQILSAYAEESSAQMILVEPLALPAKPPTAGSTSSDKGPRPVGAMVFEQFSDSRPKPGMRRWIPLIAENIAIAMSNAKRHERLLIIPGLRTLGQTLAWFRGRRLAAAAGLAILVTGLLAAALIVPGELTVEGRGHLMPAIQRKVFCPLDAEVVDVLVGEGQRVEAGETLLRLHNHELEANLLLARSQLAEHSQAANHIKLELHAATGSHSREQLLRLQADWERIAVDMRSTRKRIALLEQQVSEMLIRSPVAGTVTTFQPRLLLLGRPVRRGEALLEVMDEDGPWRVELSVQEHRMGHVLSAMDQHPSTPVTFKFAADPQRKHTGRLTDVQHRAAVMPDEGSIVRLFAAIDPEGIPDRRIGADVVARLHCGTACLAYVYCGEFYEFVQRRWWF